MDVLGYIRGALSHSQNERNTITAGVAGFQFESITFSSVKLFRTAVPWADILFHVILKLILHE